MITPNARTFKNIPRSIPVSGRFTIRGEAIIFYSDFNALNETIADAEAVPSQEIIEMIDRHIDLFV